MLKLKLHYQWPPDAKSQLIGKDPDAGKGLRAAREQQSMQWLDGITSWMDMNLSQLQETVQDSEPWHASIHGVSESDVTEAT